MESACKNLNTGSHTASLRHVDYLDSLRGIAILGVILVHSAILSKQTGRFMEIGFTGQRGVQLFYMVSAFTLFLSLDSRRQEHYELSNFFIRRFFRIAPLFYLAILAKLVFYGRGELSRLNILSGFVFLHGLSPRSINDVAIGGWSIAVEVTFYLLVPVLFLHIKTVRSSIALFLASALTLGPFSGWIAHHFSGVVFEQYFAFLWFPVEFPVFVLGIIAYITWKRFVKPVSGKVSETKQPSREISALLILTSAVLYIADLPFRDERLYFSSFLFLPLILGLSLHPWKLFVNRFTKFAGKISYSVYLCHFFVIKLVAEMAARAQNLHVHIMSRFLVGRPLGLITAFFIIVAISCPLSMVTWRFVEQPGIRIGKGWIKRREGRAIVPHD